jgi:hypothetical protein
VLLIQTEIVWIYLVFHYYFSGPEQPSLMEEPWFIGVLIGVVGGTLWLALCIFSIWLCKKRKSKKKMMQNGLYTGRLFVHSVKKDKTMELLVTGMKTHNLPNRMLLLSGQISDALTE